MKKADEEIIQKLMELRTYIEKRLEGLEEETEKFKTLFNIIDDAIISKSFRKAETISTTPKVTTSESALEVAESIPLKTVQGVLLAQMFVNPQEIQIVPVEALAFSEKTPPFHSFFVTRILESMKIKDEEEISEGKRLPETEMSYDVITEKDVIRKVVIRNYSSEKRLQEIKSSSRWTLEKMYERSQLD